MSKQQKEKTPYQRIDKIVGTLIAEKGPETAADILESINISKIPNTSHIQDFIVAQIKSSFSINLKLLPTAPALNYKKARKCCFYLLKTHANMSAQQIKEKFKEFELGRTRICNYISEMEGIIKFPKADPELYAIHIEIEKKVINFKK